MKNLSITVMFLVISIMYSGDVAAKTATVVAKYIIDRNGIASPIVGDTIVTNDCGSNVSTLITDNNGTITKKLEWTTSSTSCAAHLTLYNPPLCSDGKTQLNPVVTGGVISFVDASKVVVTSYSVSEGDTQNMTIKFTDAGGVCPAKPQVDRGVSGTICHDANKDGICQSKETVIAGVPVTIKTCAGDYNLLTDAKGNYNQDIQTPYGTIDCPVEVIVPDSVPGYCEITTDKVTSLNIKPSEYSHLNHGYIKCDSTILSYMPPVLSGIKKCQPVCYVVSDEDVENRPDTRGNSLYEVFLNDGTVKRISFTDTMNIEAIALVGNELYAIDGGTFGKIVNGKFIGIKKIAKDADGLTYDGTYLYATVRVVGDSDYIVKIDLQGTIIDRYDINIKQFGQIDIDDIAFDGTLFYLIIGNSTGKHGTQILTWQPGSNVTKVQDLPTDSEGLTVSPNGDIIVTTGIEGTYKNKMIDITTGEEFNLEVSINGYAATDFESVDCICR